MVHTRGFAFRTHTHLHTHIHARTSMRSRAACGSFMRHLSSRVLASSGLAVLTVQCGLRERFTTMLRRRNRAGGAGSQGGHVGRVVGARDGRRHGAEWVERDAAARGLAPRLWLDRARLAHIHYCAHVSAAVTHLTAMIWLGTVTVAPSSVAMSVRMGSIRMTRPLICGPRGERGVCVCYRNA